MPIGTNGRERVKRGHIVFDDVAVEPLTPKGFPIEEQNRLALDRVKSISANWH